MKESLDFFSLKKKSRWASEEVQFIKNNSSLKDIEISQMLNRSINSVRGKRRRLGINRRFQSKYSIDMNFFKKWKREMAYILGYIFADGSIRIRQSKGELRIKSKDITILKAINNSMKSNYPIPKIKNNTSIIYYLSVNRKEIVYDLMKLGIIPRKSKIMTFPEIPDKLLFHFLRGYFDGDGHVRILGNSLEITFTSGSKNFLESLSKKLSENGIKSKVYPKLQGSWFLLYIFNESRESFFKKLYRDSNLFLHRKFQIFQAFFQNHHKITIICEDCGKKIIKTGNNHKRCKKCRKEYSRELNRRSYQKRKRKTELKGVN